VTDVVISEPWKNYVQSLVHFHNYRAAARSTLDPLECLCERAWWEQYSAPHCRLRPVAAGLGGPTRHVLALPWPAACPGHPLRLHLPRPPLLGLPCPLRGRALLWLRDPQRRGARLAARELRGKHLVPRAADGSPVHGQWRLQRRVPCPRARARRGAAAGAPRL